MKELAGRVAVVTGGASGIGLALARAFGHSGMKVVLADVEESALAEAARDLESRGVKSLAVPTDVSRAGDVEELARRTLAAFGAVHVVCNNAGVFAGGASWEASLEDYEWVMGVNLWGVIHGIRSFVPILLEQAEEGHVVNTASMAAVTSIPFAPIYYLTKHAVLSLSESLYHELRAVGSQLGVSVVCPELVATGIGASERNRPAGAQAPAGSPARTVVEQAIREKVKQGIPPERIAERVLAAIRDGRFYVLAEDAGWRQAGERRLEDIRLARNPEPTFADATG